jgi:hypothetical protein
MMTLGSMGVPHTPAPPVHMSSPGEGGAARGGLGLVMRKVRGGDGKEARSRPYNKARCPHNRDHYSCRECGGAGICPHKRRKSQVCFVFLVCRLRLLPLVLVCRVARRQAADGDCFVFVQCRDCGGKSVCQHNRVRSYCKECGGGGLCHHNRVRSKCKDCGGSGICKHGRHKVARAPLAHIACAADMLTHTARLLRCCCS